MQARYRDLLRNGSASPAAKPTSPAIADEIAKLEGRMRTDRTAWFRDEAAQSRYRELLRARDGG